MSTSSGPVPGLFRIVGDALRKIFGSSTIACVVMLIVALTATGNFKYAIYDRTDWYWMGYVVGYFRCALELLLFFLLVNRFSGESNETNRGSNFVLIYFCALVFLFAIITGGYFQDPSKHILRSAAYTYAEIFLNYLVITVYLSVLSDYTSIMKGVLTGVRVFFGGFFWFVGLVVVEAIPTGVFLAIQILGRGIDFHVFRDIQSAINAAFYTFSRILDFGLITYLISRTRNRESKRAGRI